MSATGKWIQPGVPHKGWVCVDIEDLGAPGRVAARLKRALGPLAVHLETGRRGKLKLLLVEWAVWAPDTNTEADPSRPAPQLTDNLVAVLAPDRCGAPRPVLKSILDADMGAPTPLPGSRQAEQAGGARRPPAVNCETLGAGAPQ